MWLRITNIIGAHSTFLPPLLTADKNIFNLLNIYILNGQMKKII